MTGMLPLIIVFVLLVFGGTAYFHAWIKVALLSLVLSFSLEIWVLHGLLMPEHVVLFWLILFICVILSAFFLSLFGLDLRYGWFCLDMSWGWVWVWGGAVILFGINTLGSVISFFLSGT